MPREGRWKERFYPRSPVLRIQSGGASPRRFEFLPFASPSEKSPLPAPIAGCPLPMVSPLLPLKGPLLPHCKREINRWFFPAPGGPFGWVATCQRFTPLYLEDLPLCVGTWMPLLYWMGSVRYFALPLYQPTAGTKASPLPVRLAPVFPPASPPGNFSPGPFPGALHSFGSGLPVPHLADGQEPLCSGLNGVLKIILKCLLQKPAGKCLLPPTPAAPVSFSRDGRMG